MQVSAGDFNIVQFKSLIEQSPTEGNGWRLKYEGQVDGDHQDSTMKVYKKYFEDSSDPIDRIDTVLKGVDLDNLALILKDISYRKKGKWAPKQIKVIEKKSSNSDVIYLELGLPAKLGNRELVQKRLFLGNEEDPELVRRLGLFDWKHRYYVILVESTEREEYPIKSSHVRGLTKMNYILLEEDPEDKRVVKVKFLICQNLYLDLPQETLLWIDEKVPQMVVADLLNCHAKYFGKADDENVEISEI